MDAAPNFDSHPSDLGLLSILRGLVRGDEVASWMHKASIYDADPVALTARYGAATAANGDRAWYLVCKPEMINEESDARIRRIAGSGFWKGERGGKPVDAITHGGVRKKVGWRRTFSYMSKQKGQKDARAGWIAVEFKLADGTDTSTCIYKMYRSPRILPSGLHAPTAPPAINNSPNHLLVTAPAPINNSPNHLLVGVSSAATAPDAATALGDSSSGLDALLSSGVTPPPAAAAAPDAPHIILAAADTPDPSPASPTDDTTGHSSPSLALSLGSSVTATSAALDAPHIILAAPAPHAAATFGESSSGLTALLSSGVTPPPSAAAAAAAPHAPHITLAAADSPASPTDDTTAHSSPSLALSLSSGVTATSAALDAPHFILAAEAEAISPSSSNTAAALVNSSTSLNLLLTSGVTATAAATIASHISVSAAEAAISLTSPIDHTAAALAGSPSPLTTAAAAGRETSPTKKWVHVQISGSPTKQTDKSSAKRVYQMILPPEEGAAALCAKKRGRIMKCSGWLTIEPLHGTQSPAV